MHYSVVVITLKKKKLHVRKCVNGVSQMLNGFICTFYLAPSACPIEKNTSGTNRSNLNEYLGVVKSVALYIL